LIRREVFRISTPRRRRRRHSRLRVEGEDDGAPGKKQAGRGSGRRLQMDAVSEGLEAAEQPIRGPDAVDAIQVVRAEVVVLGAVLSMWYAALRREAAITTTAFLGP
jgi:hypothetical protein